MGSLLLMETLRQIETASPGWSERSLNGVFLISPDIAVDVFKTQAAKLRKLPEPFVIFTSANDPVLKLSARVNGVSERLGNLRNAEPLGDLPVTLIDVTKFEDTGGDPHFVPGTSPAFIALLNRGSDVTGAFRRDISGRGGIFQGTTFRVRKATQLILTPDASMER
jgi:esterase/lipase superfamily enzyme